MTGEINNRGPNVTPVASRRHAESVLSVILQLNDAKLGNIVHDFEMAVSEIQRLGIPEKIFGYDELWDPAKNDTSDVFVLTLIGERVLRATQTQEFTDDERGTDGCDPGRD